MVILSFIAGVAAIQKEGSMEGFDLRILVLILLTLNMLGFLIYLYARFSTLRMAGMELWAGGHLALVVCFFGVLLNIESPNPPLLFLIVIFLLTTHTLWLSASRSFFHKERLDPLLVFLPAFMVVAFAVCAVTPLALNWIEEDTLFRTGYILLFNNLCVLSAGHCQRIYLLPFSTAIYVSFCWLHLCCSSSYFHPFCDYRA